MCSIHLYSTWVGAAMLGYGPQLPILTMPLVSVWMWVVTARPNLTNIQPSDSNTDHLRTANVQHPAPCYMGRCRNAWIWSAMAYATFVDGIWLVLSGDSLPKPPNNHSSDSNNNLLFLANTGHPPLCMDFCAIVPRIGL